MKNFKQDGDTVTVTAPANVTSGGGVLVGSLFGIAVNTALSGADVEIKRTGVFEHAKNSAEAWTVGTKVYWDNTAKVFTTTATSNTLVGVAAVAASNPSALGTALLDGATR